VPQAVIAGGRDHIVPDHWRLSYAASAQASADKPVSIGIPEAGHFELIDPTSTAWPLILKQIETLAK
jgi:pimeloyl-ACP methyl ester carboxylesterase